MADEFIGDPQTVDQDGTILITVDQGAGKYTVTYGTGSSHEFTLGGGSAVASAVIESVLPNPVGPDSDAEEVRIKNKGTSPIAIAGWQLKDRSGLAWLLQGSVTLAAGESRTIRREGRPMTLNNGGDVVSLIDAAGAVRDRFEYSSSLEGTAIPTGH